MYSVQNRVIYNTLQSMQSVDTVVPDNNDTQCNTLLLDNIVLINTITN